MSEVSTPQAADQPLVEDRGHEALGRAVEQQRRGLSLLEPELDGDRVALRRADTRAVGRERVALLVVRGHALLELCAGGGLAVALEPGEQLVDGDPPGEVELHADRLGLVTQDPGE